MPFNKYGIHHIREFYTIDNNNIKFDRKCFICNCKFQLKDKIYLGFTSKSNKLICEKCSK